jgi:hypothetical protein
VSGSNTLTADRIRTNATRLQLANLAAEAETLTGRAEAAQLGYLDFVDLLLEEEVGCGKAAGSGTRSSCPACPTTRPSTISISRFNRIWMLGKSGIWPPT